GRQHEQIRCHETLLQRGAVELSGHSYPHPEPGRIDLAPQLRRGLRASRGAADTGQAPAEVLQIAQGLDQQVVAFAWNEVGYAEDLARAILAALRQRRLVSSRLNDRDARRRDAVRCESITRERTGCDYMPDVTQSGLLRAAQPLRDGLGETALEGKRMMNEPDQAQ